MVGDFVLALLLLGGGLWVLLLQSARKDRADADRRDAADGRKAAAAREEARKYQPGTALVCLGCDARFLGPLSDAGCPRCQRSALVMTQAQLDAKE